MHFEVEQKHRVDVFESLQLDILLAARGAKLGPPIEQSDQYFAHPCRDYAKTDEALRIRTIGDMSCITYKGPKLDTTTKTRRELELPLATGEVGRRQFAELLTALGFTPVATVIKVRRPFQLNYAGYEVQGAYDVVDKLGVFIELELLVDEAGLDEAKRAIRELATELELGPAIRESYLEMLLAR